MDIHGKANSGGFAIIYMHPGYQALCDLQDNRPLLLLVAWLSLCWLAGWAGGGVVCSWFFSRGVFASSFEFLLFAECLGVYVHDKFGAFWGL